MQAYLWGGVPFQPPQIVTGSEKPERADEEGDVQGPEARRRVRVGLEGTGLAHSHQSSPDRRGDDYN